MARKQGSWLGRLFRRSKPGQSGEDIVTGSRTVGVEQGQINQKAARSTSGAPRRRTHAPAPSSDWPRGKVVGEIYEVVGEIGRGGMGIVYLLKERGTELPAAAKRPIGRFIANQERFIRFTREARVWTELAAHPNVVKANYVDEVDYLPTIFTEYVDGGSVKDKLIEARI